MFSEEKSSINLGLDVNNRNAVNSDASHSIKKLSKVGQADGIYVNNPGYVYNEVSSVFKYGGKVRVT